MGTILDFKSWQRLNEEAEASGGYTQNAKLSISLIEKGFSFWGNTSESDIAKGVYAIKNKMDYIKINQINLFNKIKNQPINIKNLLNKTNNGMKNSTGFKKKIKD